MSTTDIAYHAGFYGKLPAKGDFVFRGLDRGFREAWDHWLQRGIDRGHRQLGDGWKDAYLTSPIWRFAAGPGIFGETGFTGVMMPSVDRVGRQFPLTIAIPLPPVSIFAAAARFDAWYQAQEQRLLASLADGADFAAFEAEVEQAGLPALEAETEPRLIDTDPAVLRGWRVAEADVGDPGTGFFAALLDGSFALDFPKRSIWWTFGSDRVAPSFLVFPGAPDAVSYVQMINGE